MLHYELLLTRLFWFPSRSRWMAIFADVSTTKTTVGRMEEDVKSLMAYKDNNLKENGGITSKANLHTYVLYLASLVVFLGRFITSFC